MGKTRLARQENGFELKTETEYFGCVRRMPDAIAYSSYPTWIWTAYDGRVRSTGAEFTALAAVRKALKASRPCSLENTARGYGEVIR